MKKRLSPIIKECIRMTSKKTLATLALLALVVGTGFCSIGLIIWVNNLSAFQSSFNPVSDVPVGFVFGNSENLTQEATYFRLHLENVELHEETIEAELDMIIVSQEMENQSPLNNDNSIFFLLQIPCEINNVKVDYHMRDKDPEFYGGTCEIINSTILQNGLSAILVEIPKQNFTFGENEFLAFYFTMENVFSNVNSYTYQRALTFSNNFDDTIDDLPLLKSIEYRNTATFRFLHKAELFFEEPYDVASKTIPTPNGIHYYSNHTQYSWNIKALATSVGSDSIIVDFEDTPTKNESLFIDNVMWFSLGLGIPLVISSIFEFLREDGLNQIFGVKNLKLGLPKNTLNMDRTKTYFIILTLATAAAVVSSNFLLKINIEKIMAPSLVNGMTSSMSIIVGFMGGFIGIMLHETSKTNEKAKAFYFKSLILVLIPLSFLWTTYTFLTMGWLETAIKYGLSFLSITFYLFFVIVLYSVKIFNTEFNGKDEKIKTNLTNQ